MKGNPYAAPRADSMPRPARLPFARPLLALLLLTAALGGFRSLLYLVAASDVPLGSNGSLYFTWALPSTWQLKRALFAATLLSYSLWIHRAYREARTSGADLVLSPGWAVALTFVPVFNLVAPYRAVKALAEAVGSEPLPRFGLRLGFWCRLWWGLFLASLFWKPVSTLVLGGGGDLWREAVREALWALAALPLAKVVRAIAPGADRTSEL